MKAVGPCCTWETFFESFMSYWERKHQTPVAVPPYLVRRARKYWRVYGMTGYEGFVTVQQDIEREKDDSMPLDTLQMIPPPVKKRTRDR